MNDVSTTIQPSIDLAWHTARKIRRRLYITQYSYMYICIHLLASMPSIRSAVPLILQKKKEEPIPLYSFYTIVYVMIYIHTHI